MPEGDDPNDLTFNGLRFEDFCASCAVVLLQMRMGRIPRGEICQPCARRLIAAASNPVTGPPAEARTQPVIDARLARLMGRRIAAVAPGIVHEVPSKVDAREIFPGVDIIEFDLRDPYALELMRQARKMEATIRRWQTAADDGECPDCAAQADTTGKVDHDRGCEGGNILKALAAARVLRGN